MEREQYYPKEKKEGKDWNEVQKEIEEVRGKKVEQAEARSISILYEEGVLSPEIIKAGAYVASRPGFSDEKYEYWYPELPDHDIRNKSKRKLEEEIKKVPKKERENKRKELIERGKKCAQLRERYRDNFFNSKEILEEIEKEPEIKTDAQKESIMYESLKIVIMENNRAKKIYKKLAEIATEPETKYYKVKEIELAEKAIEISRAAGCFKDYYFNLARNQVEEWKELQERYIEEETGMIFGRKERKKMLDELEEETRKKNEEIDSEEKNVKRLSIKEEISECVDEYFHERQELLKKLDRLEKELHSRE